MDAPLRRLGLRLRQSGALAALWRRQGRGSALTADEQLMMVRCIAAGGLSREAVTERIIDVVKNFQKVDASKVRW